jgi:hypothetical protein
MYPFLNWQNAISVRHRMNSTLFLAWILILEKLRLRFKNEIDIHKVYYANYE